MSQFDKIVFGKKSFSSLLEEIYENQKKKDKQISTLISELKPLINEIGDATLIVPLIKEYMEIVPLNLLESLVGLTVWNNLPSELMTSYLDFQEDTNT